MSPSIIALSELVALCGEDVLVEGNAVGLCHCVTASPWKAVVFEALRVSAKTLLSRGLFVVAPAEPRVLQQIMGQDGQPLFCQLSVIGMAIEKCVETQCEQ